MESSHVPVKSSNEILTELFGAFNAEPPKIDSKSHKRRISSEEKESKSSKKAKKSKSKKSKKKHKSKSKKHKKKYSTDGTDSDLDPSSEKVSKKRTKTKDKKHKKRDGSPTGLSIELPVSKVPIALEILLDGTVGIKGEDGMITKISNSHDDGDDDGGDDDDDDDHDHDHDENSFSDNENGNQETHINGNMPSSDNNQNACEGEASLVLQPLEKSISSSVIPDVFEAEPADKGEKPKRGKIQIRDLKFSSVFQETVKAVEEKQKKEQEKKESHEEGELSDSGSSGKNSNIDHDKADRHPKKSRKSSRHKHRSHRSHSKSHHCKEEDLRIYLKQTHSHSRSRSRQGSHSRHQSTDRTSHRRIRSHSRDYYHGSHYTSRHSTSQPQSQHSRGRTREGRRSRSRSRRSKSQDGNDKSRSRHRSKSIDAINRSRTKSKERSDAEKIDKEKLLAIARKNALKLIDAGVVPGAEKLTILKAGGKTVNELTEYCKKLSKKEALGDDVSDIESESSDEEEKPFHHPFQVRDRPNSIIMNIKNSIPLPVKSMQEKAAEQSKQLRLQFPVSSGSSHRRTESEWIPVSPKKDESKAIVPMKAPPLPPPVERPPLPPLPPPQPQPPMPPPVELSAVPPPEPFNKPVFPVIQPSASNSKQLDISSIVSKRLEAIRKLQENPNDSSALSQMYNAQQEMQYWAESKQETGAFTGSTGAKVLSASELSSGAQAWAKRDQLTSATPVKGGMGMALLQKMGWQPGEGLGKNKEGTLEPLKLEVKMDKKGLLAADESRKGGRKGPVVQQGPPLPTVKTLDGKHPVSLLNEFCSRRRYGVPQFELCFECGPDHKKNFLFKVKVNGIEYTPSVASPNKKQAKAEAAAICLRALGVISSTS